MIIANGIEVRKSRGDMEVKCYLNGTYLSDVPYSESAYLYNGCRGMNDVEKRRILRNAINNDTIPTIANHLKDVVLDADVAVKNGLTNLISFMSEFSFTPNFRFVNTFARRINESVESAKKYVENYFKLTDSPYVGEIINKLNSPEFNEIMADISTIPPTKVVNDRLNIYYGAQGTGKTTAAMKEAHNLCIVCNSSMLPADLMEDFTFDDGKATFHPSALARCMEEGRAIVLDEINLLPFDSLRFLQGIADGKSEFTYKGNRINIRKGFKIIGTMNLAVNGVVFGLPEPLVDRCDMIEEFELNAEQLMMAF